MTETKSSTITSDQELHRLISELKRAAANSRRSGGQYTVFVGDVEINVHLERIKWN